MNDLIAWLDNMSFQEWIVFLAVFFVSSSFLWGALVSRRLERILRAVEGIESILQSQYRQQHDSEPDGRESAEQRTSS